MMPESDWISLLIADFVFLPALARTLGVLHPTPKEDTCSTSPPPASAGSRINPTTATTLPPTYFAP